MSLYVTKKNWEVTCTLLHAERTYIKENMELWYTLFWGCLCTTTADTVQTQDCAFDGELLYNVLPHPLHTSYWPSSGILLCGRAKNNMWVRTHTHTHTQKEREGGGWGLGVNTRGFQNKLLLWSAHFILQRPKNTWRLRLCARLTDRIIIATNSIPGDRHLGIQVHQPMCEVKQICNNNSTLPLSHTWRKS